MNKCENKRILTKNFTNFLVFISLVTVFFSVFALSVQAAEIFFLPETKELKQGEPYEAELLVSSSEMVNAFEGKIMFSKENLKLEEIKDGNSLIKLWIERPKENESGSISFSGITPGGYVGEKGRLFSIIFKALDAGSGQLEIKDAKVLKSDGFGTPAKVITKNLEFKIQNLAEDQVLNPKSYILNPKKDTDLPESFKPEIAQSPDIFDGKYFLVFTTQDKGSGIAGYEVREGFLGKFISAESPYLLQNQKLNKKIFIKAIDREKNERIEIIYPQNWSSWYENYWIMGIIMFGIIAGYFIRRKWGKNLGFRI